MADNPTWEICERVAEVQALLDDHFAGGKHTGPRTWWQRRRPSCRIRAAAGHVRHRLLPHAAKSYRLRGFCRSIAVGRYQYAGVISRHNPVGNWVLFPFPPRAVHDDGGLAGEACSMIEHRPLTSRRGIPYRGK